MNTLSSLGPGHDSLMRNELNGRTLVDRGGEVTLNCFIDNLVWNNLQKREQIKNQDFQENKLWEGGLKPGAGMAGPLSNELTAVQGENLPPYYEWATTQVGMICVRQKDSFHYDKRIDAQNSSPVLSCCQLLTTNDEQFFTFAGVTRSSMVFDYDDMVNGMKRDEHFTLAVAGKATLLNNGTENIKAGDPVKWTFYTDVGNSTINSLKKQKKGPRRVQVMSVGRDGNMKNYIGRALSSARPGGNFDLLIDPGA